MSMEGYDDRFLSNFGNNLSGSSDEVLEGMIFMSNKRTFEECIQRQLFGLPMSHASTVTLVKPGMKLFLFEYQDKLLYGVFEALTGGGINLVPDAFKSSGGSFPAQVHIKTVWRCDPLCEREFKNAILRNYYTEKKFHFYLHEKQVLNLIQLFATKIQESPTKTLLCQRTTPHLCHSINESNSNLSYPENVPASLISDTNSCPHLLIETHLGSSSSQLMNLNQLVSPLNHHSIHVNPNHLYRLESQFSANPRNDTNISNSVFDRLTKKFHSKNFIRSGAYHQPCHYAREEEHNVLPFRSQRKCTSNTTDDESDNIEFKEDDSNRFINFKRRSEMRNGRKEVNDLVEVKDGKSKRRKLVRPIFGNQSIPNQTFSQVPKVDGNKNIQSSDIPKILSTEQVDGDKVTVQSPGPCLQDIGDHRLCSDASKLVKSEIDAQCSTELMLEPQKIDTGLDDQLVLNAPRTFVEAKEFRSEPIIEELVDRTESRDVIEKSNTQVCNRGFLKVDKAVCADDAQPCFVKEGITESADIAEISNLQTGIAENNDSVEEKRLTVKISDSQSLSRDSVEAAGEHDRDSL